MTEPFKPHVSPSQTSEGKRLARNPMKTCVKCHETYPNTADNFVVGPTGRITSTCLVCDAQKPHGQPAGECPVCGERHHLAADNKGPKDEGQPLRVCRRCLLTAGTTDRLDSAGLERLTDWLKWRRAK